MMNRQMYSTAGMICLVFGLVLVVAASASAFDNQRRGFNIGFGAGPGFASYTQTIEYGGDKGTSDRQTPFAIMTDFKIGAAPSNQVQIYWTSRVSWFSMENVLLEDVTIANGWGGLGISYFLQPQAPSLYLTGAVGFSSWGTPFEEDSETWYGIGFAGGAGYEFVKHWSVEGTLAYGKPSKEESGIKATANALAVRLTLVYNAY